MSRYQFNPPPRITAMADLDSAARKYGADRQAIKACALHESAHALAAIMFKRPHVLTIIRTNGAGRTLTHDGYGSNHGTMYEEAVVAWCGLITEQVLQGAAGDVVDDEARSDHTNALSEATEYAAKCMEVPPLSLQEWCGTRTPRQRAALAKRVEHIAITESLRDSRTLVCNYWPLIEEMAYVALRDSGDGVYSWTGQPRALDWVHQRVAEIDFGKKIRKTAYPCPKWLRTVGGAPKNKDLLVGSMGLSDRISSS